MAIAVPLLVLVVTTTLLGVASAEDALSTFSQLGQTFIEHPSQTGFGSAVDLSEDGSRIAVGSPNDNGGAVFLYESDKSHSLDSWRLVYELIGKPGDGIGAHLSLSADGRTLAVRRSHHNNLTAAGSNVEVYQFGELAGDLTMLGDPVSSCGESKGGAVKLGETSSSSIFGERIWLLVSCETVDNNRGAVGILWFDKESGSWQSFSEMIGEHPRGSFGSSLGIFTGNPNFLQVAVASPNYDNQRGSVQIFYFNEKGESSQLRGGLEGLAEGDLFGFSMQMNTRGRPSLVIGAPQCDGGGVARGGGLARGCVEVYRWSRPNATELMGWEMIGNTLTGLGNGDMFGKSVAISFGPTLQIAASSTNQRCNNTGLVSIYEFEEGSKMNHAGDFLIRESNLGVIDGDQMGFALGLSKSGSIIVAGSVEPTGPDGQSEGIVKGVVYNSHQPLLLSPTSCDLLPLNNSSDSPITLGIAKSPTQAPTSLTFPMGPTSDFSNTEPTASPTQVPTTAAMSNQRSPVAANPLNPPDDENDDVDTDNPATTATPKNNWAWIIISGVSTVLFCVVFTACCKRPWQHSKEEEPLSEEGELYGV